MKKRTVIATASAATAFILISCCATTFNSRYNTADAFNIARRPFSTTTNAHNNQASVFRLHAATPTRTSDTNIKRTTTKDIYSLASSSPPDEKESELSSYPSSSTPSPPSNHYDRQEFEMQVGRAMDTLRTDYPDILIKDPDYSIYSSDLELIDPSGVHLHGVQNYEKAIRIVHSLVGIFYCPERSSITFRMCFDKARQNIRIHWNARIIPKAIFGGTKTTLHVDGISIYELDRVSGNITQHRLERLVMNDDYVTPEQGVFAALRRHAIQSEVAGIPSLSDGHHPIIMDNNVNNNNNYGSKNLPNNILHFQDSNYNIFSSSSRRSILFRDEDASSLSKSSFTTASSSRLLNSVSSSSSHPSDKDGGLTSSTSQSQQQKQQTLQPMESAGFDQSSSSATTVPANSNSNLPSPVTQMDTTMNKELETKNLLRKKFGLKPLDMEEFVELEGKVAEMDIQQKKKVAAAMVELERAKQEKANSGGGFLNKMFGNVLKDTCESNYDCESPEVCCDFGIKKMCCSSGMRVFNGLPPKQQGQMIKVPLTNPNPYPPGDPRNRDPWG